jgi:hypothetical protein
MVLADVLLGYFISRVLDKKSPTARPPLVVTPPGTTTPTTYTPTVTPTTPTVTPSTPTFPTGLIVPASTTPAAGLKKAVEVWVVKPQLQTVIVGMQLEGATSLAALEQSFPQGWQAAKVVTSAEINTAKSLLPKWKEGGVIFMGPQTTAGRRAYRMTKHPATAAQPAAVPMATPASAPAVKPPAPSGIVPASYTPPAATPAPTAVPTAAKPPAAAPSPPQVQPPAATPAPAATVAPGKQITAVRRGEGLAQISKRLGMGETAAGAITIQKANVPQGPDARWQATDLRKGGLKKVGRAGGLQPGDKLFVPATWGPYDAKRL